DAEGSVLNLYSKSEVNGTVGGQAPSAVNILGDFTTDDTFKVGQFNIGSDGALTMRHDITVSGGFLNEGMLYVPAGEEVKITGNYTQHEDGFFQTGVNGVKDAATQYGKLHVTGNADLSANNKIGVVVTSADTIKEGTLS